MRQVSSFLILFILMLSACYAGVLRQKVDPQGNRALRYEGLGQLYLKGDGVAQSNSKASYYFRLSAMDGDVEAMERLGINYLAGIGVPKSVKCADFWWQCAAKRGSAVAMDNLGQLLVMSSYPQIDLSRAYFVDAAKRRYARAEFQVGMAYWLGTPPFKKNLAKAQYWLFHAAQQQYPGAALALWQIK